MNCEEVPDALSVYVKKIEEGDRVMAQIEIWIYITEAGVEYDEQIMEAGIEGVHLEHKTTSSM